MVSAYLMMSCNTHKVIYLQDIQTEVSLMVKELELIKFMPGDRLRVLVHSRDPEIVRVFNLISARGNNNNIDSYHSSYVVDQQGYIDMPVLGRMKIAGLTREETINQIKYKLLESRLVKDPVVTIEYDGLGYYMLGEISRKGRKEITRDHVTLLEAIAEAGDLVLDGRRDNILVLRTINGEQIPYRVSLLDVESLYSSPVYYLQQNDIVYVEPNRKRVSSTSVNGTSILTPGFWISMFTFTLSLVTLLFK